MACVFPSRRLPLFLLFPHDTECSQPTHTKDAQTACFGVAVGMIINIFHYICIYIYIYIYVCVCVLPSHSVARFFRSRRLPLFLLFPHDAESSQHTNSKDAQTV